MRETRLYCDRCGNEIPNGSDWVVVNLKRAKNFEDNESWEICTVCTNHLIRWLKE